MNPSSLIGSSVFFKGLGAEEIATIAGLARRQDFKGGDQIFAEGSEGTELYIMPRGRVSIEIALGGNAYSERIHEVKDGEVFGELSLLDGHRRSATTRALEDVAVFAISRNDLLGAMERHPRIGYVVMRNLAQTVSGKLRDTTIELRNALMQQTHVLNRIY